MKKAYFILIVLVLLTISPCFAQVPAAWPIVKTELTPVLQNAKQAIQNKWDGQNYCTSFSSNLGVANSARGYALLTPNAPGNAIPAYQNVLYKYLDTTLTAFDTLGLKTVDITINYPILVPGFPHQADYLAFYKKVADMCRQHGKTITVEVQASFIDTVFGEKYISDEIRNHYFNPDGNNSTNDTLTLTRYRAEKTAMMQLIIDSVKPDFLTLAIEPVTESANLMNLIDNSPDTSKANIQYYLNNLTRKGNTLFGAGAGSWDDLTYFIRAAQTNIDFINYHVYPVGTPDLLPKTLMIDSIADAHSKKLIVGEAWLYKITQQEKMNSTSPIATSAMVYSRDFFDYWVDLDTLFFKTMILLSQQSKIDLMSFFWTSPFFGQVTWNNTIHGSMNFKQLISAGQQAGYNNMYKYELSALGTMLKREIAGLCVTATGINTPEEWDINVYPNPTDNVLYIDAKRESKLTIVLTDITGKVILNTSEIRIDLQNIKPGLYILKINSGNKESNKRIMIN